MAKTVIFGSFGIDDIETPFEKRENLMGGAAPFAAYASSFFSKPGVVGIVGDDYPQEFRTLLEKQGIDLSGVQVSGKTFRWGGKYKFDMNDRDTLKTELNCMNEMKPEIPKEYEDAEYVLLGNWHPSLQLKVLEKFKKPKLVVLDTMNLWIETTRKELMEVISRADILMINDSEARQLFETTNLAAAARKALDLGLRAIVIKKGEHGALMFTNDGPIKHFNAPGFPLEVINDPTGCGDAFAGAFLGYAAKTDDISEENLRKAVIYGSVVASFNAEDFSLARLTELTDREIGERYKEFARIREF